MFPLLLSLMLSRLRIRSPRVRAWLGENLLAQHLVVGVRRLGGFGRPAWGRGLFGVLLRLIGGFGSRFGGFYCGVQAVVDLGCG